MTITQSVGPGVDAAPSIAGIHQAPATLLPNHDDSFPGLRAGSGQAPQAFLARSLLGDVYLIEQCRIRAVPSPPAPAPLATCE